MQSQLTHIELLKNDNPLSLAEDFEGYCPCCHIKGIDFSIIVHCWRSNENCDCEFSGIHVTGNLPRNTKIQIAEHVRDNNGWSDSCDWTIVIR